MDWTSNVNPANSFTGRIAIHDPRQAEKFVAHVLRQLGWPDAQVTGRGSDGGVDVRGSGLVAQVRARTRPQTGAPALQRLTGIAVRGRYTRLLLNCGLFAAISDLGEGRA